MEERYYLCIDLKSFYASVECVERGLDPMRARLVVADPERSQNTICLAVSPEMKALGVKNRCRIREIPRHIDYIVAQPRMQTYIDYAAKIYGIYLHYIACEDIHVYSIDEAFVDVTPYLSVYRKSAREMGVLLMSAVEEQLGIRATCGIGTNLYLAKIALDLLAKRAPDFIGELDEESYRERLWNHRPLSDFWRIGPGIMQRLARMGITTMRDITEADERELYRRFGIDAELLIDHAWGRESATMRDIKAYQPKRAGLSSGQVLMRDYSFSEGKLILQEMCEQLCLDMLKKSVRTQSMSFYIGYSQGEIQPATRATVSLPAATNLRSRWVPALLAAYMKKADRQAAIRRVSIVCHDVESETAAWQIGLFDADIEKSGQKEREAAKAQLRARKKFGNNALVRAVDLTEAATAMERNRQIGGHKA